METADTLSLKSALDRALATITACDRDLKIIYANRAARDFFGQRRDSFATVCPDLDGDHLVGMGLESIVRDIGRVRRDWTDARNLPAVETFTVAGLTLELSASAMLDDTGSFMGTLVQWNDVTDTLRLRADLEGKARAISKTQAVIEFELDGTILTANENFLGLMGYTLDEIRGKHHGIFVDAQYRGSAEYRQFWETLGRGEYQTGQYRRVTKQGREVWIQGAYNPIFDERGVPFKVVKYATDITQQRLAKSKAESMFSMIEGATANFMTCDCDLRVTYINPSLLRMFQEREHEIRKVLPKFDSRNIIGMCIDDFHKNPALQRRILADQRNLPAKAEIKVGSLEFQVTATALVDSDGALLGNAAEWTDLNDRATYSREVQELIKAGLEGDLKKRGRLDVLADSYRPMMQGINEILDAVIAPINEAGTVLQQVGQQDLSVRVEGDYQGDHAAIKENLNGALESLEVALGRALEASRQVNQASEQIAASSQTLAEGASEQASALEEVSASLEELTAMTSQNAENASQADVLAKESRAMATRGNEAMASMEVAINKIKTSSDQTAKIIKTIDEIAFQTNLLALNAAVEAARAGEAGKGFAVVAEEVRNLAARSAEAAKNTAEMIEESVRNAEGGVKISSNVAEILKDIMESASKVSDFIAEIAAASKEQAIGLNQINKAVSEMDKVTQSNAAGSEESAAAAEELSAQAESLGAIISAFRLSHGASGMPGGGYPPYMGYGAPGGQPPYWGAPNAYWGGPPPQQPRHAFGPPQAASPRWQQAPPAAPTARPARPSTQAVPPNGGGRPAVERRVRKPEEVIPLDDSDLHDF